MRSGTDFARLLLGRTGPHRAARRPDGSGHFVALSAIDALWRSTMAVYENNLNRPLQNSTRVASRNGANGRTTLIAVFDDRMEAERAIRDLEAANFRGDQLVFVIRGSDATAGGMITDTVGAKDGKGAAAGAITGAVAGGVLAAAASVLLPGAGPVLAAG